MPKPEFINFRELDPAIDDVINLLKDRGAYSNMMKERKEKVFLERAYDNVFNADITVDSDTIRTNLIRSHIVKTVSDIYARTLTLPLFNVDPVNDSTTAFEEKTVASIAKSYLMWFIRVSGYEEVFTDGLFEQCPYGDSYVSPFVLSVPGKEFVVPLVEDRKRESLMLDPNCSYVQSESFSKQAQYYAYTQTYPAFNLASRFGDWILDFAQPGSMVDEGRLPNDNETQGEQEFYEVLEIQNKSTKQEFVLVGANAVPAIRISENDKYMNAEEFSAILPQEVREKVSLSDKYKYKDRFGRATLTLGNNYFYFRDKYPYNRGLAHKLAVPQVMHEIIENLKTDNIIKRLDQIAYITGGNSDKNEENFRKYRQEKRLNRNAILYLHSSLNNRNVPQPGVIKFEGLTAEEGRTITNDILDFVKNCSGVDPRQAEVQKNIALGQSEIIEEKSTEAIQAIADKGIANFKAQLNSFIQFGIGHKGFGLNDVKLNFTRYDENTPEGNDAATISIPKAMEKIAESEFKFIIDKSSLLKKSKFLETQQLIEFLGLLNPQTDPEGFIMVRNKIGQTKGLTLPEVEPEAIALSEPTGGKSQFAGKQEAPQEELDNI